MSNRDASKLEDFPVIKAATVWATRKKKTTNYNNNKKEVLSYNTKYKRNIYQSILIEQND